MQRVRDLSSLSSACLESSPSPSFSEQDLSPGQAGFESECLRFEFKSESQGAEISQL